MDGETVPGTLEGCLKKACSQRSLAYIQTFVYFALYLATGIRGSDSQWVGHVDPEILNHYTHIHDQQSQEAMRRLMSNPIQRPVQGGEEQKTA